MKLNKVVTLSYFSEVALQLVGFLKLQFVTRRMCDPEEAGCATWFANFRHIESDEDNSKSSLRASLGQTKWS